jgi:hypothetical protein
MFKSIFKYLLIVFMSCGYIASNPAFSDDEKPTHLFTEDEAKQLRHSNKEWDKEVLPKNEPDTLDRPSIIFEEPLVKDTDKGPEILAITPTNFFVVIKQNDSPLDMGTIEVWGEKFFLKIDVTDRVLKYLKTTKDGAVLHAKSIHIPKGHYKVGISIKDINGKKTEKKYRLKVE